MYYCAEINWTDKLWERHVGVEYKEAAGPRAGGGREAVSTLCRRWNKTVFCPKFRNLTYRSFDEERISCKGDISILSLLLLPRCLTSRYYIPVSLLQLAKQLSVDSILPCLFVTNSFRRREVYDFPSWYSYFIFIGFKGPSISLRNFNKHIEIASWLILRLSLLPVHFTERSCGQEV